MACLAAAAFANHLIARRNERKHPPPGHFIDVNGVRLHYVEHGDGKPVVLIHGNGSMAEEFAISGVVANLAVDHRVIAIDRPGYGYSDRPRGTIWDATAQANLMWAALHKLNVRRPVLLGHSWGTLVVLAMALECPDDTRGLVLLSGYYEPTWRLDIPWVSAPAIPVLGTLLRYTILPLLGWLTSDAVFRKLFDPSPVTPAFKAQFPLGLSLRPSQLRASATEAAMMVPIAAALRRRYRALSAPIAILAGTGDCIVDFRHQSLRFADQVPKASLLAVDGAGHMVHHVAPDRVAAAARQFADP
jgi:pimeloyl-ACP methyl ester carboxylesterase